MYACKLLSQYKDKDVNENETGIIILAKMDYIIRLGEIPYSIIKKEYVTLWGGKTHYFSREILPRGGGNLGRESWAAVRVQTFSQGTCIFIKTLFLFPSRWTCCFLGWHWQPFPLI